MNVTPQPQKAGVVVLKENRNSWRCLLLRANESWGFPKGALNRGETPLAAAKREVQEETSLYDLYFRWGDIFIETQPLAGHKVARYYLALTSQSQVFLPVSAELGRAEHDEFRWTRFVEAKALLSAHLRPVVIWAENIAAFAGELK